jgi:hypothetical protein
VTWHATHCCTSCMKDPHAGNHGPKCDCREMSSGTGPHPPSYPPRWGARRDSRERHQGVPMRGGGRTRDRRDSRERDLSPAAGSGKPGTSWRDDSRERGRSRSRGPVRRPWAGGRVVRGPPQRGGGF